jgi:hypothetical protein
MLLVPFGLQSSTCLLMYFNGFPSEGEEFILDEKIVQLLSETNKPLRIAAIPRMVK